jgi:hypothetical protein
MKILVLEMQEMQAGMQGEGLCTSRLTCQDPFTIALKLLPIGLLNGNYCTNSKTPRAITRS